MVEIDESFAPLDRPIAAVQREEPAPTIPGQGASRRAGPTTLIMNGLSEPEMAHPEAPPPHVEDDALSMELDLDRELNRPMQAKSETTSAGDRDLDVLKLDSSEEFKLPKRVSPAAPVPAPAPRRAETPVRAATPTAIDGQSEVLRQEVRQPASQGERVGAAIAKQRA